GAADGACERSAIRHIHDIGHVTVAVEVDAEVTLIDPLSVADDAAAPANRLGKDADRSGALLGIVAHAAGGHDGALTRNCHPAAVARDAVKEIVLFRFEGDRLSCRGLQISLDVLEVVVTVSD